MGRRLDLRARRLASRRLICLAGASAHCGTCRDPAAVEFRRSGIAAGVLPLRRADEACPFGLEWGARPAFELDGAGAPAEAGGGEAGRLRREWRQRLCLLDDCEHYGGRVCQRVGGCLARQIEFYERELSRCPLGVW